MSKELIKKIQEERKFLHDLANQLTISQGMSGLLTSDLANESVQNAKITERMIKLTNSTNKMIELLKERRSQIVKEQEILEEDNECSS